MPIAPATMSFFDIPQLIQRFEELTGMQYAKLGLWNIPWEKNQPTFEVVFPDKNEADVLTGPSKYLLRINEPEMYLDSGYGRHKKLTQGVTTIDSYFDKKVFAMNDKHGIRQEYPYVEINFLMIVLYLMLAGEIPQEDAYYRYAW